MAIALWGCSLDIKSSSHFLSVLLLQQKTHFLMEFQIQYLLRQQCPGALFFILPSALNFTDNWWLPQHNRVLFIGTLFYCLFSSLVVGLNLSIPERSLPPLAWFPWSLSPGSQVNVNVLLLRVQVKVSPPPPPPNHFIECTHSLTSHQSFFTDHFHQPY